MISLCIPTWNRTDLLFECIDPVLDDERVSEIVISDDCSDEEIYEKMFDRYEHNMKVKFYRNEQRLGVYENKKMAVERATNDWVIIGDSDNVFGKDYIDKIFSIVIGGKWFLNEILAPDFARPEFDYQDYSEITFSKGNVSNYVDLPMINCLLNTMNYFVNRNEFLRVWKPHSAMKTADSIYFNYLWLAAGNYIHVVKGLQYFHRIHDSGYYNAAVKEEGQVTTTEVEQMIKQLS